MPLFWYVSYSTVVEKETKYHVLPAIVCLTKGW